MMTTFLPVVANVMARLVETNVFPAWGFDEVTIMTFISPLPRFMKFMFERIMRKTSDTGSRPFSRTTKPALLLFSRILRNIPRNGAERLSSMSFLPGSWCRVSGSGR